MGKKTNKRECGHKAKSMDLFGEDVGFEVGPGGERMAGSWLGFLLSVVIFGIVLMYTTRKFINLHSHQDTAYTKEIEVDGGSKQEPVSYSDLEIDIIF
jgi:hypothetical protein